MATRTLSEDELRALDTAGEWGLLRDMNRMRVCVTGRTTMERTELARLIEAAGGTFTNTMRADVRLLIVADDAPASAKVRTAEREGVRVMAESQFAAELLPTPEELLSGERALFGAPR